MNLASLISERLSTQQTEIEQDEEALDQELENILNHPAPAYFDKAYWNERYTEEPEAFDWYQSFERLNPVIGSYFKQGSKVLCIGCGNSTFSKDVLENKVESVSNVDFSEVVIKQMKEKYESEKRLTWDVADATKLPNDSESIDVVFDKGTLDSMVSNLDTCSRIPQMLAEISRVLKPGGKFIEVTYGTPHTRSQLLTSPTLQLELVETKEIEKVVEARTYHYIYVLQKK